MTIDSFTCDVSLWGRTMKEIVCDHSNTSLNIDMSYLPEDEKIIWLSYDNHIYYLISCEI